MSTIPGRTGGPQVRVARFVSEYDGACYLSLEAAVTDVPADREHTDHTRGACRSISIMGEVIRTHGRGDRFVSGGQNVDALAAVLADPDATLYRDRDDLAAVLDVWRAWHLADMTAGCDHQGDEWMCRGDRNEKARAEAVRSLTYKADQIERTAADLAHAEAARELRSAAARMREHAEHVGAAIPAEPCDTLNGWPVIRSRFGGHPYPHSGTTCYVCGRNRWDEPTDACPVTGYRWGTSWLARPVPDAVVDLLIRVLDVPYRAPVPA